ncbi:L-aspartate oxidase [Salibacterium aidingense]|uniref:L-aspartate oxidase n=1 Tax=Salibacterium aidingense TaxID=384933 RepID=UPI0004062724|nr:L-aspartate oxidase [Salibacterium aidingense]
MQSKTITTDVVIIGSGLAGLMAGLQLAKTRNVTIVTKSTLGAGNSERAQGGIAAPIAAHDTSFSHIEDTLAAGYGHNHASVVEKIIEQAGPVMEMFFSWNTPFDKEKDGTFQLAKEGAHSRRRIFHAGGDATGFYMMERLKKNIPDNLRILEFFTAYDLLMDKEHCAGLIGKDRSGSIYTVYSSAVVLASGGCGQLFPVTSNAPEATGDGLAMAFRAGAKLKDMEFMQFHPTMLFAEGRGAGLLSEVIRGEGGVLVDEEGGRIMKGLHPLEDLAPRAVVAQAVFETLEAGRGVFLDIRNVPDFENTFPTIAANAGKHGVDPAEGYLPVRPGAHFMMGGIAADARGRTSVEGLYAIGEAACTGMHGANRLASNSLLEAAAGAKLLAEGMTEVRPAKPIRQEKNARQRIFNMPVKPALQQRMEQCCGLVKDKHMLVEIIDWLKTYQDFIFSPGETGLLQENLTTKNMLTTAWMMAGSALARQESRGAHIRRDYPDQSSEWGQSAVCWQHGVLQIEKETDHESVPG